jgi:hypothetical protein
MGTHDHAPPNERAIADGQFTTLRQGELNHPANVGSIAKNNSPPPLWNVNPPFEGDALTQFAEHTPAYGLIKQRPKQGPQPVLNEAKHQMMVFLH